MRVLTLLAVLVVLILSVFIPVHAQTPAPDYAPEVCPYPESRNYRPNIGHTVQDHRLLLVDVTTGATLMTLDEKVLSYRERNIFWAQNCRYLVAQNVYAPYEPYPRRFTSLYDTFSGQRIFQSGREIYFQLLWSPTQEQFIIKSPPNTYLMNEAWAAPVLLFDQAAGYKVMRYYEWDMARGQLMVSFSRNSSYLMVYDIYNGATLAAISQPEMCTPTGVYFTTSADSRYLLVYTFRGEPGCVTVYDRDTGTVVAQVNGGGPTARDEEQFALSPDGRYLVVGLRALRVWDLQNLPESFEERLPLYRHEGPIAVIQSLHFVSGDIVETTSQEGLQRWNILTGEQVNG